MAITYASTASFATAGTQYNSDPNLSYKDVTITAATGDLLVVIGYGGWQNDSTGSNGLAITQSGTTSAWTVTASPDPAESSSPALMSAYATVSAGGSITVRAVVGSNQTMPMGVGLWCVPAAEWTSVTATTDLGPLDTDGAVSVTLTPSNSLVIHGQAGDDAFINMSSVTLTPSGATEHLKASWYLAASWTGQASGTRTYGLTGQSGGNQVGVVFEIEAPAAASVTYVKRVVIG